MTVEIKKGKPKGVVSAPPSKSMAHRYLICAALAKGKSVIHNVSLSKDIEATIGGLRALGAEITLSGSDVNVKGIENFAISPDVFCDESGSTLRFLLPICLVGGGKATLRGSERLMERPLKVYEDICRNQGIKLYKEKGAIYLEGRLKCGDYPVAGNISSQFISGLLFSLPLLSGGSKIVVTTALESRPYIDMTLQALREFGVEIEFSNNCFVIPNNCKIKPAEVTVEGDYSNAAFFEALSLLHGGVAVTGLNESSLQGDKIYREYFQKIKGGNSILDITDCPDLGPVLMAVAAAMGGAEFCGTARLKIKESDRGAAMAEELKKFCINTEIGENTIKVSGNLHIPNAKLCGHNDHRIVMSLAVLCTLTGGIIEGSEAVDKSFPDFFEKLSELGIEANILGT